MARCIGGNPNHRRKGGTGSSTFDAQVVRCHIELLGFYIGRDVFNASEVSCPMWTDPGPLWTDSGTSWAAKLRATLLNASEISAIHLTRALFSRHLGRQR